MSQSLREIANWMDPDKPAQRLYGNGPPFESSRPQHYDLDKLSFDFATVDVDSASANPPKTRVVSGPVDLKAIEKKVSYDGIRYLDAPSGTASQGTTNLQGGKSHSSQDVYKYNLFFADQNAYDLGMVNRTSDNGSLPKGYKDKGIIESHRWVDPADSGDSSEEWRSVRNVVDRHRKGVRHRMLSQNLELIPSRWEALGKRKDVAAEFGKRFGDAGFDIVGMSEIYSDRLLNELRQSYSRTYPDTDQKWAPKDYGVLVGRRRTGNDGLARDIVHAENKRFKHSGPAGTGFGKEGWLRVVIEVPALPGDPKFEVFVTHLQPVIKPGYFDAKQQAKIAQMRELRDEIAERNRKKPEHPKIVMGDFNIHSSGRPGPMGQDSGLEKGEYFSNFMHQMHSVGMQDIWLTYGGPGPPNKKCKNKVDGYLCPPFTPKSKQYYQGGRIDYVFLEKPRSSHNLHIDLSRAKMTGWPAGSDYSSFDYLSDHVGIAFDVLTSPGD